MRAEVVAIRNPFDPIGSRAVAVLRRPLRIRRLMPQGRPAVAVLNGRPVLRAGWRRRLRDGDRLAVIVLPRGGGSSKGGSNPLRLVLSLALMAFAPWAAAGLLGTTTALVGKTFLGQITTLGIYMAGNALINALLPPPKQAVMPNPSPTYNLQAQGNVGRLDAPIPVQYGRVLSYPDFAAQPYAEYAGNEQYLYQLLCLGAGEFEIEQLRIEDTPISAFDEITVEVVGPGGQVTLFPTAVVTSVEVSGQELRGRALGTWAQSATTITVTETAHNRATGQAVHLDLFVEAAFTRSGTTLTVTEASHTRTAGQTVFLSFPNGELPYTTGTIATVAAGSWTVTLGSSGSGSGMLEVRSALHPSGVYQIATVPGADSYTVTSPGSLTAAGKAVVASVMGNASGFVASAPESVAHRIGIDLVMPRGIYKSSGGGLATISLSVRIEAQRVDDIGLPIGGWVLLGEETITDRTNTPQRRTFTYDLATPGRYRVRAWRLDEKSTVDADGHEVIWAGLRAYLAEPADFGPVTLIALRMRASNNLSAQASRKIAVLATRKLPVWTGSTWTAPQATRSIAWALADAARNADYGARLPDSRLDLPALLALDAIWAERGDTFNGRFDSAGTWWDSASKIAMAGRSRIFMQGGKLRIARDGPASVPVQMFSERNILKGTFALDFAMPGPETADAVDVQIFDGQVWQPRRIKARLPGSTAARPAPMDLFGVTSAAQALREGLYQAAANRYRRETVRFETEMEGFIPSIGDLIAVQHSMPGWGQQAEAVAWDAATLRLRVTEPLDWSGTGHVAGLRARDGSVQGAYPVTRGGADDVLQFAEAPDPAPFTGPDAERTHVAFGQAETWRALAKVASVTPRTHYRVLIEAVVEDPAVHTAETGAVAEPVSYSALPRVPVQPVVGQLMARSLPDGPGLTVLAWRPAPGADSYQVELADGFDLADTTVSWTRVADTTASQQVVTVGDAASTLVRVRGLGLAPGPWAVASVGALVGLFWLAEAATHWGADPDPYWRT
ncbi:MAG: host specificity factor TipJ family phage tail protein [Gemmobacter sp.]|uniref:host specificity factor TipJ family phage tail protein n=1 Tax=Gemmobacter sp. TaxID=1898957 RepID=UPI00391C56B8